MIKKNLFITVTLLCFKCFAQAPEFEINGTVVGIDTGSIQFFIPNSDSLTKVFENKTNLKNGKFTFKGQVAYPDMGIFIIDSKETIETNWFYLEAGRQMLTIQGTTVKSDSKIEDESQNTFKPLMAGVHSKLENTKQTRSILSKHYNLNIPFSLEDSILNVLRDLGNQQDSLLLNYIKRHPNSYVALRELAIMCVYNYKPIYETCFLYLDNKLKTNTLGAEISKKLESLRATYNGAMMPIIPVVDIEGNKFLIDKSKLKEYTLCDFWFSNCGYCILQFPRLNAIYDKWKSKGFEVLSISTDRKKAEDEWKKAIKKYNLLRPQYWDIDGIELKKLSIVAFPSNLLIDKDGKIVAKNIEMAQLEKFLDTHLTK